MGTRLPGGPCPSGASSTLVTSIRSKLGGPIAPRWSSGSSKPKNAPSSTGGRSRALCLASASGTPMGDCSGSFGESSLVAPAPGYLLL